jgi:hypothetical protein
LLDKTEIDTSPRTLSIINDEFDVDEIEIGQSKICESFVSVIIISERENKICS